MKIETNLSKIREIRKDNRRPAKQKQLPTVKKCPICGFKIKGKNHNEGEHHKKKVK
jgi:ribosomal protein L32